MLVTLGPRRSLLLGLLVLHDGGHISSIVEVCVMKDVMFERYESFVSRRGDYGIYASDGYQSQNAREVRWRTLSFTSLELIVSSEACIDAVSTVLFG